MLCLHFIDFRRFFLDDLRVLVLQFNHKSSQRFKLSNVTTRNLLLRNFNYLTEVSLQSSNIVFPVLEYPLSALLTFNYVLLQKRHLIFQSFIFLSNLTVQRYNPLNCCLYVNYNFFRE